MCDAASNTGCGYQILQEGSDGRLHAVSYGGKALTKAQTRWLPAELELAALCLALKEIDVLQFIVTSLFLRTTPKYFTYIIGLLSVNVNVEWFIICLNFV